MEIIEWDKTGERYYETGVDHGVLYLQPDIAVPWNGLTSVTDEAEVEVKPYYMDGNKYLDHTSPDAFSGTLKAFTYPEEFEQCVGHVQGGVSLHGMFYQQQELKPFMLSYRTLVGNDLIGLKRGYKLHVMWNLTAVQASTELTATKEVAEALEFEWKLTSVPVLEMTGIRPTAHIAIDSRSMHPIRLERAERMLYGYVDDDGVSHLPNMVKLASMQLFVIEIARPID